MENKDIIIVASGNIEIPPKGYGAIEDIIRNYKIHLEKNGYNINILNTKNIFKVIKETVFVNNKIIHFHYEPYLIISYILNKLLGKKNKILFTCHNGYITNNKETIIFKILAKIIGYFKGATMISISKPMEKYFINKGFKGKSFILQNGINTKNFKKINKPKKDIIYLGNINQNKGQKLLLKFYKGKKKIDFVGPYRDKNIKLGNNNYLGVWTKKEVFEKLGTYKILVLLSKSEGDPMVVKEALTSGCSILTSKIGGINLEENDFIKIIDIESNQKKQITQKLEELIENNQKQRKKIRKYSQKFNWKNIIKKYLEIINLI